MTVMFGIALSLAGVLMMLSPMLDVLPAVPDLFEGARTALRTAWPVTRDDGAMGDAIDKLEELK